MNHSWQGNVRELKNIIENIIIFCDKETIELDDLPEEIRKSPPSNEFLKFTFGTPLEKIEELIILQTLAYTENNKTKAAELLGISRRTLQRKLKEIDRVYLSVDMNPSK